MTMMRDPNQNPAGAVARAIAPGEDQETLSIIKQLFPDDYTLLMKTEIPAGLVLPLARAEVVDSMIHSPVLRVYIDKLLRILISKDRQGRNELIETIAIAKGANDTEREY